MTEETAPQPQGSSWVFPVTTQGKSIADSASRTSSGNTADHVNQRHKGIRLLLDVTAVSGTGPTLDVKLQGKDPASGTYYDIPGASFSQKSSATSAPEDLIVYPGIAETANRGVSDLLPPTWRVAWTLGGTNPDFTFSIGAEVFG